MLAGEVYGQCLSHYRTVAPRAGDSSSHSSSRQGTSAAFVALIHSGIVKLVYEDGQGKESLLGLRTRGWWINSWFAVASVVSIWRVETVTECTVTEYSTAAFADLLSKNPASMVKLLACQSNELVDLRQNGYRLRRLTCRTCQLTDDAGTQGS